MKRISIDHHPKNVAVIGPTDDMVFAAREARKLIADARHVAVVVQRLTKQLNVTCAIATPPLVKERRGSLWSIEKPDRIVGLFGGAADFDEIGKKYGPDFAIQGEFLRHFGSCSLHVRSVDDGNSSFHIDTPRNNKNAAEASEAFGGSLPFGTTVVMSVRGGGTQILVSPDKAGLFRAPDGDSGSLAWCWDRAQAVKPNSSKIWQIADGDFAIMHAKDCGADMLPCVHRSPPRERDGSPHTRIVGVAFVDSHAPSAEA